MSPAVDQQKRRPARAPRRTRRDMQAEGTGGVQNHQRTVHSGRHQPVLQRHGWTPR